MEAQVIGTLLNFAALKIKGRKANISFSNKEFVDFGERSLVKMEAKTDCNE